MYSYIKGTIEELYLDHIVIDNNNIGYRINVSSNTLKDLQLGNMAKIYTKLIVREDDMSLCGFSTKEELEMFELLTSVSKIGPKVGLGILSFASPRQLGAYIVSEDIAKMSKAPGVGKKTAERIILELKDKIKTEEAIAGRSEESTEEKEKAEEQEEQEELIQALQVLGYRRYEINKILPKIKQDSLEEKIKEALQYLA